VRDADEDGEQNTGEPAPPTGDHPRMPRGKETHGSEGDVAQHHGEEDVGIGQPGVHLDGLDEEEDGECDDEKQSGDEYEGASENGAVGSQLPPSREESGAQGSPKGGWSPCRHALETMRETCWFQGTSDRAGRSAGSISLMSGQVRSVNF
jgi:hypothetical protein